jgi:hypothetical protein
MSGRVRHRGPDDAGHYIIDGRVALGHRWLSMIDLSQLGHQPMIDATGVPRMWGDQAASGDWWTVLGIGSNRLPKLEPNAPL